MIFFLFFLIEGKVVPSPPETQQISSELEKRPTLWLKSIPIRRNKQMNSIPNDVEFIDETDEGIRKRFDNYGHMRFGKRGGPGGFDDYGDYG